jgi:hypothetical protein
LDDISISPVHDLSSHTGRQDWHISNFLQDAVHAQTLKQKLTRRIVRAPLYDVARWVTDFDQQARMMWDVHVSTERYVRGHPHASKLKTLAHQDSDNSCMRVHQALSTSKLCHATSNKSMLFWQVIPSDSGIAFLRLMTQVITTAPCACGRQYSFIASMNLNIFSIKHKSHTKGEVSQRVLILTLEQTQHTYSHHGQYSCMCPHKVANS